MALAELNVRLGLLTRDFDRNLRKVERSMQASVSRISSLGSSLTTSISLPIAAVGAIAIKSAGDIESLRLALTSTMESAGRSTADVAAELEKLRQVALAPGIDFAQAIKASVRLQSVGISAEDARAQIVQLANAVAAAGGTAQNLDSVTVQFAQMIAKGKVFTQDLKIIKENIPSIGKAMEDAFGTQSAEELQALGVSAKEFIAGVTKEMAKAPRVASGIKNSIVNLFVGLQLEAARFGDEINKAFNIGNAADAILGAVKSITDGFASLSDGTKRIIVNFALLAAAAGPLISIFGKLFGVFATLKTGFIAASNAIKVLSAQNAVLGTSLTGLSGAAKKASVAFGALNAAQRALLVGGVIAAIAGLVIVFNELTHELSAVEKAQESVSRVSQKAAQSISSEKVKATELIGVLKDENATRDEQARALKALQSIAPTQFGNLDIEKAKTEDLDAALDGYIDGLLRAAKAKRAFARLEEIQELRDNIIEAAEPSVWQKAQAAVSSVASGMSYTATLAAQLGRNVKDTTEALNEEEKAMREIIKANGDLIKEAGGDIPAITPPDPAALEESKRRAELYAKALASIQAVVDKGNVLGADVIAEQAREIESQIERLLENGFKPAGKEIQHLKSLMVDLFRDVQGGSLSVDLPQIPTLDLIPDQVISLNIDPAKQGIQELKSLQLAAIDVVNKARDAAQEKAFSLMQDEIEGRRKVVAAALSAAQDIANSLLSIQQARATREIEALQEEYAARIDAAKGNADKQAVLEAELARKKEKIQKNSAKKAKTVAYFTAVINIAEGITKALASAPPPFNGILAAITGAAGAAQLAAIAATPLAHGGVIDEPTLALIGEYPGAKTNPEIVTPEKKLKTVFEQTLANFARMETPMPAAIVPEAPQQVIGQNFSANPQLIDANITVDLAGAFRLRNDDLLLAVDEAAARRGRYQ